MFKHESREKIIEVNKLLLGARCANAIAAARSGASASPGIYQRSLGV